jgi:hypothetical protein
MHSLGVTMPRTMLPLPSLESLPNRTQPTRHEVWLPCSTLGCIHLASTLLGTDTAEQAATGILCIECTLETLFKRQ